MQMTADPWTGVLCDQTDSHALLMGTVARQESCRGVRVFTTWEIISRFQALGCWDWIPGEGWGIASIRVVSTENGMVWLMTETVSSCSGWAR